MERNEKESGLLKTIRNTAIDGVKVVATSSVLAFFGLAKSCSKLPSEIGITVNENSSGAFIGAAAFDLGAGAFAGYTGRYAASLMTYGATLIPEIYDIFSGGDIKEASKIFFAKTLVYGGGWGLGYFFSKKKH